MLVPGEALPPNKYGGIERIAYSLISYLSKLGHELFVLANPKSQGPFQLIPEPHPLSGKFYKPHGMADLLFIRKLIQEINPDLVHDFFSPPITTLCPVDIPLVWSLPSHPPYRYVFPMLRRRNRTLIVGCAHHVSKYVPSLFNRCTIYNSADYQKYVFDENPGDNAPLVFLGRLDPIKGAHIAIRVAQKTGEPLIIAGNIPVCNRIYFQKEIEPHLSDNIRYIGPVDDKQKNELFRKAKAFLFPLQWHEPFGITVTESMSCGTPVITFPYGSMPELIRHGVTGYLCKDEDDMVKAVQNISRLSRMACRKSVEEYFSPEEMSKRYLHAYYEMLSEKSSFLY
jgi:glycosyltransferase involved in cell wall biosynthesis